jgi:hypothetical protein
MKSFTSTMLLKFFYVALVASSVYAAPLTSRAPPVDKDLIKNLMFAPTAVDRIQTLLAGDAMNFVFNFAASTNKTGNGNRLPVF